MQRDYQLLRQLMEAPKEVAVDYLIDGDFALPEVLHLFAGCPPYWSAGLSREVLAGWLQTQGDARAERVLAVEQKEPDVYWEPYTNDGWLFFAGYAVKEAVPCPRCGESRADTPLVKPALSWGSDGGHGGIPFRTLSVGRDVRLTNRCPVCGARAWTVERDWPEVREAKREVLALFKGVLVTKIVTCGCVRWNQAEAMASTDCGALLLGSHDRVNCGGRGWVKPGGTTDAARLIPEMSER